VLAWRSGGPMSPAARELVARARRLLRAGDGRGENLLGQWWADSQSLFLCWSAFLLL